MSPPGPRARSALTLFTHANDVYSHAARIVLALKGLPHDLVYVDPQRPPADLASALPDGVVLPTLMEREVVLYEARIIAEYLDERFPHPPLLPSDPLGRARTRLTVFRIEQDWVRRYLQIGATIDADDCREQLRLALVESDPLFKVARFFLSSDIGLADCLLLPLLWRLPSIGLALADLGPGIESYAQKLFQTPLFQRSLSDAERALAP